MCLNPKVRFEVELVALRPIQSPSMASGGGLFNRDKPRHVSSARCAGKQGRSATLSTSGHDDNVCANFISNKTGNFSDFNYYVVRR